MVIIIKNIAMPLFTTDHEAISDVTRRRWSIRTSRLPVQRGSLSRKTCRRIFLRRKGNQKFWVDRHVRFRSKLKNDEQPNEAVRVFFAQTEKSRKWSGKKNFSGESFGRCSVARRAGWRCAWRVEKVVAGSLALDLNRVFNPLQPKGLLALKEYFV